MRRRRTTRRAFEDHRARAVEEGAEKRRHFLRIRVGGLGGGAGRHGVRAHPHPGPHAHPGDRPARPAAGPRGLQERGPVAGPPLPPQQRARQSLLGARSGCSRSAVGSVAVLGRAVLYTWRLLTGGYAGALPDGTGPVGKGVGVGVRRVDVPGHGRRAVSAQRAGPGRQRCARTRLPKPAI
ncbi:hypothetical protein ACRAWF_34155 [Streptomyces sp. L7]